MTNTPEPLTLQERINLGDTIFLVRPQDMITMAKALERNGDFDLAAIIKKRFPHLFPTKP
jgi:hypothetical protein